MSSKIPTGNSAALYRPLWGPQASRFGNRNKDVSHYSQSITITLVMKFSSLKILSEIGEQK